MGEIIKFDFNKNKKIESEEVNTNEENFLTDEDRIEKLAMPFLNFIKFVLSDEWKKFKNIKVTEFSYNEARETVKNYSNEELVNWLINSNENEWVSKPSFYKAIYYEMMDRLPERYKNKPGELYIK